MISSHYLIYALGFFAQALFGSRMIFQWILSERARKVVSPTIFWQISLLASFLFMIYGLLRLDGVIILGQLLSYYIYIRNIQLKQAWHKVPLVLRIMFFIIPVFALLAPFALNAQFRWQLQLENDFTKPLMGIGLIGQLALNLRFLYQWYYSEKFNRSMFPVGFWVLSILGSVLVVVYAVYRRDPVLLLAQSFGLVVYVRNVFIARKQIN